MRIFRVDNPHTKPFPFWEWMIAEVRKVDPGAIFLAEAFTRPKVMKRLAKVGYNQSYSYFTWRNTKAELAEYLTELTQEECAEYMRPNFFVNTPDINPVYLQVSGRPGFQTRLALAASLAGNYGVYSGFELCEFLPVPGKEEYLNSEKYEIRAFDWKAEGNIREDIAFFNRIRREEPALQRFPQPRLLQFLERPDPLLRQADAGSFLLPAVPRQSRSALRRRAVTSRCRCGSLDCPMTARSGSTDMVDGTRVRLARQDSALVAEPARTALRGLQDPHADDRTNLSGSSLSMNEQVSVPPTDHATGPDPACRGLVQGRDHLSAPREDLLDSNGDGIGDFAGLLEKLDYIQELGVTAIWLLPFYPSPLRDDGYDISDYRSVNPSYGNIEDVERLIAEAHHRGMRVITELVINHTSDQHPWFQAARNAPKGSPERDFYVWADDDKGYDAPGSSSPTPRHRTGPGTRSPSSISGTASSRTSRT